MIACVQRCSRATVRVGDEVVGAIDRGILVLLGVERGDDEGRAIALVDRLLDLRMFQDDAGKMNLSLRDVRGDLLVVSQFTLAASLDRGRRPSFDAAAPPGEAEALYRCFVDRAAASGLKVATGRFGAKMAVELVNDGPVTFLVPQR